MFFTRLSFDLRKTGHQKRMHSKNKSKEYTSDEFGKRFDALIKSRNLGNDHIARKTGISPEDISRLRRGHKSPSYQTLMRLLDFFDVDIRYFKN